MRTIADHIYDISYNSIKANSKDIILKIKLDKEKKEFIFYIKDNGEGIEKEKMDHIFDPFYTSRDKKIRKVGLGLPLLKQNTEITGGAVSFKSEKGVGTELKAMFKTDNIDILPLGDISGTIVGLITANVNIEWEFMFENENSKEKLTTQELKDILGEGIALNNIEVIPILKDIIGNILEGLGIV
ncbi:ATP-binding protein [Haliovirga abyssi]|uniref:histidine kinase n=1 Tax=Haliovirga abyssi TaxID=2996794 RepID=A0AAU9DIL2_9FUSO|nr:ATP-binding protein [Haliovirga abyssi]BDU50594.1 histidine kinase [Haliovirga abyssi]